MHQERPSITTFLTDGSLLTLCDALASLSASPVRLTDERGREVARENERGRWLALPERTDSPVIARALEQCGGELIRLDDLGLVVAPIMAEGAPIGSIALDAAPRSERPGLFEHVERVAQSVAMAAGEFCADELKLRRRAAEQNILYRLSSLLVGTTDLESTFNIALRSAAEVFGADAGCVFTFDAKDEKTLTLRAHTGLSDTLRETIATLPASEILDREALDGEVVLVRDLLEDRRALHLEAIESEGFRGLLSFGITYQRRRIGLIRLYARRPIESDRSRVALFRAISEQVAAAVAAAKSLERAREHRQLKRQLKLAGDVQRRMLPRTAPTTPGLDVAARYEASFELGGDFYDVFEIRGMTGVVIGDVVGKGVPAALLMSSTRAFFRAHLRREPSISEAVERVNRELTRDTLDNEFVTALIAAYDDASRTLHLCSAGHDPPLLARRGKKGERTVTALAPEGSGGMLLGIDPAQRYSDGGVALDPGDVVLAYTDGASEAMNFDGKKFGAQRVRDALASVLEARPCASAQEIVDHVLWEIRRFTGLAPSSDDITLVAIRVMPES